MTKKTIYLMGLATLFLFPIPAFIALYFTDDITISEFLDFDSFRLQPIFWGCIIGVGYAGFANLIMKFPIFKTIPLRVDKLVSSMNLTVLDSIFLAICAGVGEELLFRVGIQHYLGYVLTSILFVAIHGYLNPMNWRQSLYGLVVLPLSFLLGYCYETYGLWCAISIHFAYDLTLFLTLDSEKESI